MTDKITIEQAALICGLSSKRLNSFRAYMIHFPTPIAKVGCQFYFDRNAVMTYASEHDASKEMNAVSRALKKGELKRQVRKRTVEPVSKPRVVVDQIGVNLENPVIRFLTGMFDHPSKRAAQLQAVAKAKQAKPKRVVVPLVFDWMVE